jgi:ABC-type dipeptide/oligopeptide/nickel transport system permease subunit
LLSVLGPGLGVVVGALVLVSWTYPARVVYGETLRLRETAFVEAARALGAGTPRIIVRHIVPQLGIILLIYFTLNAATMVLLEAGLGFLGFGVQPPTPSWGAMIHQGRDVLFWPWLMLLPGICLALLGTGFYLVGAGLQRATGPRLHRVRL